MKFKTLSVVLAAMLSAGAFAGNKCCNAVKESKTNFASEAVKPFIESGELPGIINVFYKNGVQETTCAGWADVSVEL